MRTQKSNYYPGMRLLTLSLFLFLLPINAYAKDVIVLDEAKVLSPYDIMRLKQTSGQWPFSVIVHTNTSEVSSLACSSDGRPTVCIDLYGSRRVLIYLNNLTVIEQISKDSISTVGADAFNRKQWITGVIAVCNKVSSLLIHQVEPTFEMPIIERPKNEKVTEATTKGNP